jgi:hypothetical protein
VLDVELRLGRDVQALASHLDGEGLLRLDGVGKAAELGDEPRAAVGN